VKRGGRLRRLTPLRARRRGVPAELRNRARDRDGGCRLRPGTELVGGPDLACPPVECAGRLDPHHVLPRGRGGPDTVANLATLCRLHHEWVHSHPATGRALGLLA